MQFLKTTPESQKTCSSFGFESKHITDANDGKIIFFMIWYCFVILGAQGAIIASLAIECEIEFYGIDLLAILQKSLDRAIFLYNFIHEARLSAVRASIAIVHIRKFYKL